MAEAKRLLDIEVKTEREERRNKALLEGTMDTDDTGNAKQAKGNESRRNDYSNNSNTKAETGSEDDSYSSLLKEFSKL